jgi:hypothetical protein
MLTKLLEKKPVAASTRPMIEVLNSTTTSSTAAAAAASTEIDYGWDQTAPETVLSGA